jgi:large repetitive protein
MVVALAAFGLGAATSCNGRGDCGDGSDNDADGFIDGDDPGCEFNGDSEAPDPSFSACGDAVDNDGDGAIDLDDPGCESATDQDEYNEPVAGCKDGVDNDGDQLLDFPNDPGCQVSLDDDEADDCPNGSSCPACSDGIDDDGDEVSDYPDDLGCDSASDGDEFNADPTICGGNVPLAPLPADGIVNGFLDEDGTNELISLECGGSGNEAVYQIVVEQPITLVASTNLPETEVDTVLYLREQCRESATELVCNDDVGEATGSRIRAALDPGTYYLVVDARSSGLSGSFKLQVNRYIAAGSACNPDDASASCPPNFFCRLAEPDADGETCERAECNDNSDFDGDGLDDYPDDPGCESLLDNDEDDTCPGGASCPQCGDGVDNNDTEDSRADYPADLGCTSAADDDEQDCTDSDPLLVINQPTLTGNTSTLTDDFQPECNSLNSARDRAYRMVVPGNLNTLSIDTNGSNLDTVLTIRSGDCTSDELACDDDGGTGVQSLISMTDVAAGVYYVVVDGFSSSSGAYTLHVHGVIANGQPCNATQVTNGLWSCAGGGTCTGGTCQN